MDSYVYIDGKKYRRGYTTGSTSAAAAKAAASLALLDVMPETVLIKTPKGIGLTIKVSSPIKHGEHHATASAIKDGGDDIDATNGAEITAEVTILTDTNKINVTGGKGVGYVTKKGLSCAIGGSAINPVPHMMITSSVREIIGETLGASVVISVIDGEEIAKRTFNPRLGIIGGISILGTSGIVEPMSDEAWRKSLAIEMEQKSVNGMKSVVLVPGNHGEKYANSNFNISETQVVRMSNFVGFMLFEAVRYDFEKILIIGHIGKLVKLAGGIFNTHSKVADARADIICVNLALLGVCTEDIKYIYDANTAEEASERITEKGHDRVFNLISQKAKTRCQEHVYDDIEVEVMMYDMQGKLLGHSFESENVGDEINSFLGQVEK